MGRFVVWQPMNGQTEADGVSVTAFDARTAVEEWAEHDDSKSNEFHIVGGQPATVLVRDLDGGEPGEWIVSGEALRRYTAKRREAPTLSQRLDRAGLKRRKTGKTAGGLMRDE